MLVEVPHMFEGCDVDHDVALIVTLPGERTFQTQGRIRHRRQDAGESCSFGVQFLDLADLDRKRVASYVTQRLTQGGGV